MEENNFETDRKPKPFDNIICEGGEPIQANISIQFRCGLKNEARMRNKIAERVQVSNFYRTLFYGLKWNHEHNVAMVNPLAFVLRRVLYALVIVFMADQNVLFSALIILVTCLITLVFVVQEGPWEDRFINWQHFFNEIVFYFVCVGLMCFSGILTESEPSLASGWLLIGLILSLIAYNIIIILYDLCIYHRLFILRYFKGHIAAKANQRRNRRLRTKKNKILIEKNGDQKCKKLSLSSSIDDDILKIPLEQSQPASIILSKYSDKDLDTKEFNLPLLVNPKPQQKPIIEEICFEEDIINQGPDTAIKIIEEADYEAFESKPDLKNEIDFDDNLKLNGSQDDAGDNNKVVALSQSYGQFDQPDVGNSEGAEDKKCNGNQDDAEDNNKFVASSQSYNQFDQPDVGSSKGKEDHQVMQTINQDKQIGAVEQEPQLGQLDSLESLGKSSVEMVAYGQSQRNKYGSEGLYGFENDTDQGDNLNELNESPHIQFNRSTDDLQELPYTNQKDLNDLPFKMQFHKSSDDINEPTYSIKETPGFRKKMDAPRIGGYTDARVPHENSLLKRTMTAESNAAQNYGNALEVPKKAKFTSGQRFQKAAANNFFGGKKESVDNTAMDMDKISAKRGSQDSVSNQAVGLFDQKKLARSVSMRVMKEDKLNGGLARQKGVKFLKAKGGSLLTKRASLAQAGSNILN